MQIKIVALNARFTHSCLALFHVRNELEKNCPGVATELCQLTINDSYYETFLRLSHGEPDYIFFSAAVWNSDRVEQLIRDLQSCLPDCGVVVGGPQAEVIGRNLAPSSVQCGQWRYGGGWRGFLPGSGKKDASAPVWRIIPADAGSSSGVALSRGGFPDPFAEPEYLL